VIGPFPLIISRKVAHDVLYVQVDVAPEVDAAFIVPRNLVRSSKGDLIALYYAALLPSIAALYS
jgi:hypothetical protein